MPHDIVIEVGALSIRARLNDSPTAQLVWEALPISARANTWGDEIYFQIPVEAPESEDARAEVRGR